MSHGQKQPRVDFRLSAGKLLWGKYGGVSDRRQRAFLHTIANLLRNPERLQEYAVEITNLNPRALCNFVFPDGLRTPEGKHSAIFVTPYGGASEGVHPLQNGWQGTIQPAHAIFLAEKAKEYASTGSAVALADFNDRLLGINLYPMATSADSQNEVRAATHKLEEPTVQGSIDWATAKSDLGDISLLQSLTMRVDGLSAITSIIGKEGSPEREQYLEWYKSALGARLAKDMDDKIFIEEQDRWVSREDIVHDTAAILCATLEKSQVTMAPRKVDQSEAFLLMEIDGLARCYEGNLPKNVDQIGSTAHHMLGGSTMVKVVVKRHSISHWEITSIRPLAAELVGSEKTAAADPKIQEVTSVPYSHGQLKKFSVFGSEFGKPLFGKLSPNWTSLFADRLRRRTDALPTTAHVCNRLTVA
jgi:hypothetical protein